MIVHKRANFLIIIDNTSVLRGLCSLCLAVLDSFVYPALLTLQHETISIAIFNFLFVFFVCFIDWFALDDGLSRPGPDAEIKIFIFTHIDYYLYIIVTTNTLVALNTAHMPHMVYKECSMLFWVCGKIHLTWWNAQRE